jgi:RHS repeat-associated protein
MQFSQKQIAPDSTIYYFGVRTYSPRIGRWLVPDPAGQGFSPYVYCGNNPLVFVDEDGELAWFAPILIGAVVGGTSGGIIAHNNGIEWWKGAITGAFIGAGIGAYAAPALGASGMYTTTTTGVKVATDGWGIATSIINGSNINMVLGGLNGAGGENLWKFGLVGAGSGAFTATGGIGLAEKGFVGRLGFQGIGTAGRSIGNNWANGVDRFRRVTLGFGPINLSFGEGQKLLQLDNNIGNVVRNSLGIGNLLTGGRIGFNPNHLSFKYGGGWMKKIYDHVGTVATGAHAIMGTFLKNSDPLIGHEAHHIWQSRSIGDTFLLHYLAQGLNSLTVGANPFYRTNYFETQAYGKAWWNY